MTSFTPGPSCRCWSALGLAFFVATAASAQVSPLTPFTPNDPLFAPNVAQQYPGQWYLVNNAPATMAFSYALGGQPITAHVTNIGLDAKVAQAWARGLTGKGVVIGIVGITGLQGDHPDLAANYRADLSRQFSQDPAIASQPQGPLSADDNHDTAVAGIAAAAGGNGLGMTGTAPHAGVAGFRVDNPTNTINAGDNQNYIDANYFASGVSSAGVITGYADVSVRNRSYARTSPFAVEDPRVIKSLNDTAANNVVNVFAAGNFRGSPMGDTGRMQRNSLASAIAVGALGSDGIFADYSNYGASLFVTAPGARLDNTGLLPPTIDRTGSVGYNPGSFVGDLFPNVDYTTIFNGTSATAPIVSGIVALGKQLVPFLDVRMAQHAFATTSRVVDANDASSTGHWQTNGAGLKFNPNYGFGLVDAAAFVSKAEVMAFVTAPQTFRTGTIAVAAGNRTIDSSTGKTEAFTLSGTALTAAGVNQLPVEGVEITLDATSPDRTALAGTLTSPAGTVSTFMTATNQLTGLQTIFDDPAPAAGLQWTFLANNFWGEDALGTWNLNLSRHDNATSTWNSYALTFHLGRMVLESGSLAITADTTANSAQIDFPTTTMTIAGDATFSVRDEVWVNDGTLRVDGRLQNMAAGGLARSRVRLNGGQLTGTGTIATSLGVLNGAGTVRPGIAGAGTLTIDGDYAQGAAGVLEITLASNSSANALVIRHGTATLAGTLLVQPAAGATITAGATVPVIRTESAGRIEGAFQSFDNRLNHPTLQLRGAVAANSVYNLEVYRDYITDEISPYLTAPDREVGAFLGSLTNAPALPFDNLLQAIDRQTDVADAAQAVAAAAPFAPSLAPAVAFATGSARFDTMLRRARRRGPGDLAGLDAFVELHYASATVDGADLRPAYRFLDRGIMAGVENRFAPGLAGGFYVGTSESRGRLDTSGGRLDGSQRAVGVHATWDWDPWRATAIAEYGWSRFDRTRRVEFPGFAEQLRSTSDSRQLGVAVEIARSFDRHGWRQQFFGGLRTQRAKIDGYRESGASGWDVAGQSEWSTVASLGYDASRGFKLDIGELQPFVSLTFSRDLSATDYALDARVPGASGGTLQVHNRRPDPEYGELQTGLVLAFRDGLRLYTAGQVDFGRSQAGSYGLNLGLARQF